MNMTVNEIECEYRQAKSKSEQLKILADENCCTVEEIKEILIGTGKYTDRGRAGLYPATGIEKMKEAKAKLKSESTEQEQPTVEQALEVLKKHMEKLAEIEKKARADVEDFNKRLMKVQNLTVNNKALSADKTVIEDCPHCGNEVEIKWDIEISGLKAYCPYCGKRLMLCSECEGNCDYCTETDNCRMSRRTENA